MTSVLSVRGVSLSFGGVQALQDVSLDVAAGEICAVVGPNGAGKTTLLNCVSRFYDWDAGAIQFDGKDLRPVRPKQVAALGIARTIQNVALFPSMSVLENILVGGHSGAVTNPFVSMVPWARLRASEQALRRRAGELIEQLGLAAVAYRKASEVSVQTGKRVELARALMSAPKLLLLDEPAAGLNHEEVAELADVILGVRREAGVTIVLVEHHMGLVMSISSRVCVLNFGQKIADGPPDAVQRDPAVVLAYLGELDSVAETAVSGG